MMMLMKYLFLLTLFISVAEAGECKLTGITRSCQKLETKFEMGGMDDCLRLAKKTGDDQFFQLVEKDDRLTKTIISFKKDSDVTKDEVSFGDDEACI